MVQVINSIGYRYFSATDRVVIIESGVVSLSTNYDNAVIYNNSGLPSVITSVGPGKILAYGAEHTDQINGSNSNDTLYGGGGRDLLVGGNYTYSGSESGILENVRSDGSVSGNDYLDGGTDADAIYGFDGDDVIFGGDGNDHFNELFRLPFFYDFWFGSVRAGLYGGDGNDFIDGGRGDDWLEGGAGQDRLLGGDDNDSCFGGAGADVIHGQDGNDTLVGGADDDFITGGLGDDSLEGDGGADALLGDQGNDTIYGDGYAGGVAGDDWIEGGNGHDILIGQDGNDVIFGQDGNDQIYGGAGFDVVYGGAGYDNFRIERPTDGADFIGDFSRSEDLLVLQSANFGGITNADKAAFFYAGTGFSGFAVSGPFFAFDTTTGHLWYNNAGAPTLIAQLTTSTLSASDFFFA